MHHIDKYDRYHMVELAVAENPHFQISAIEMEREGPSYTADTIRLLKQEASADTEFYFIAGTDAIADLPTWKYNRELLESCHFICASRPGDVEKVRQSIRYFGPLGRQKFIFTHTGAGDFLDYSSRADSGRPFGPLSDSGCGYFLFTEKAAV